MYATKERIDFVLKKLFIRKVLPHTSSKLPGCFINFIFLISGLINSYIAHIYIDYWLPAPITNLTLRINKHMKKLTYCLLPLFLSLCCIVLNAQDRYQATWQSLENYKVPDWFRDAKFGIFIHWGLYSVPAFGYEWYPRSMYIEGSEQYKHHIATYGPQDKFGYKDFIPLFKAEKFDPAAWAHLFKESGAKYVVPVFEHHDGFAMYDSSLSDWTAVKMGPHRDLVGDLAKAVRAEGLHLGASSHRVEHNFYLGVGRTIASDVNDPEYAAFYGPAHLWLEARKGTPLSNDFTFVSKAWTDDWLARSAEIVQKYHPEIMWFDWWIGQPSVREDLARFAAFYYNASLKY